MCIRDSFYAGGVRSVRGYRDNTLGPVDFAAYSTLRQPIGGSLKTVGSLEMFFPTLLDTPSARVSAFVDVGNVFKDVHSYNTCLLYTSRCV